MITRKTYRLAIAAILVSGCARAALAPVPRPHPPETVRSRIWLWGHEAGAHNHGYGLERTSRMTPAEALLYFGVRNLLIVREDGKPEPPYDQYAVPLRSASRLVWSVVGASGKTEERDRQEVLKLAAKLPNMAGVIMDDFFRASADETKQGALSVGDLQHLRQQLMVANRRLGLWVTLYSHQLSQPLARYLDLCDTITFWTWRSEDLEQLEINFAKLEKAAPKQDKVLGLYMYDYGNKRPMPLERMKRQAEIGLGWLREGRIAGMIFLATCIGDLDLESVEWTRSWIAEVGDLPLW